MKSSLLTASCLLLSACQLIGVQGSGAAVPDFEARLIDADFSGGYGLASADIDGDGLKDIIALSPMPSRLVWYRNPDWGRHVIETGTQGNIDVAPLDIDGDRDVDLVLASEFNLRDSTGGGMVHWLENPGEHEAVTSWSKHLIDSIPTSHRLRWADIAGNGRPALFNLPIIGRGAEAPGYDGGAELTAYTPPRNPRRSPWGSVVIDAGLEMAHGLEVLDWDGDGREDLLTASFRGVDLFQLASGGLFVRHRQLLPSQPGDRPGTGMSEVAVGSLSSDPVAGGAAGERFLATIEPWHGNQLVVYRLAEEGSPERQVLDAGLAGGHALQVADLNGDGDSEIIVGGRSQPYQLLLFGLDDDGRWRRHELGDGSIAVSDLLVEDFTGDGRPDIVALGSATGNLLLFSQSGR